MAVVTPKLRRLMAETFLEKLAGTSTENVYFFFGRSKPWTDPDAKIGIGNLSLAAGSTTLTISDGNFSGIPDSSTIKNLDNGEVRKVALFSGNPPIQATVNAPPGVPWSTSNWAWKEPAEGSVWKDDNNPPPANGSQYNQFDSDLTMLALKKINQSTLNDSMSYVVKRFDWDASGQTMYAMYRDNDGDLFNHPTQSDVDERDRWNSQNPSDTYEAGSYWVVVNYGSNYHVFKCLDNGSLVGQDPNDPYGQRRILLPNKSTQMPDKENHTAANDYTYTYSDRYTWKFLYTLSADQVLKFLTDSWIPVKVAADPGADPSAQNYEQWLIQQNAKPGAIDIIRLIRCDNPVVYLGDTENENVSLLPDQSSLPVPLTADENKQVKLPATANTNDDYYVGCDIYIYDTEDLRTIVDYDGANQVATVDADWSTNPVENNSFCIAPKVSIIDTSDFGITITEAKARAVVNNSGYISKILVLNKGLYYRLAKVNITYKGSSPTEQLVAFAEAEVSPIEYVGVNTIGGHGYNPVKELGGFDIMFYTQLRNIEGYANPDTTYDFIKSNEYRTIGIVRNILEPGGTYPTADTLKAVKTLVLATPNGNPDFSQDEVLEYRDSGDVLLARAYVVEYVRDGLNPDIGTLTYYQDLNTDFGDIVAAAGTLRGLSSGAVATVTSVTNEETYQFSGDILYIEQRKPIVRASEQLEDVKLVIEF